MKYICFNKNSDYAYEINKVLIDNLDKILDFFEVKYNSTFELNIYVYENLDNMYKALNNKNIETDELSYHIKNSLYFIEPNDNLKEEYKKTILIEEIKCIEHLVCGNHPEWLMGGISDYVSDIISIKQVFENNLIDHYYSYIIVSYLIEYYTKSIFVRLIHLKQFIDYIENNNFLDEAINYYNKKYNIKASTKRKS